MCTRPGEALPPQFRLSQWRWRLSAIELPEELRVRAAQELIKRIDKR